MNHVEFTVAGRKVKFDLTYDFSFAQDRNMSVMLRLTGNMCEPEVVHLMARVLRSGDLAVDGGACVGFFSILMSQLVGPTGKVLAFEPGVNNLFKLRQNLDLNKSENVAVIANPLWHCLDTKKFYMYVDSGENSLTKAETDNITLLTATLDETIGASGNLPRLIKLDIEGAEEDALRGATTLLARKVPYIVCEMHPETMEAFGHSPASLHSFMLDHGYEMFHLSALGWQPRRIPRGGALAAVKEFNRLNFMVLFSTVDLVEEAWNGRHGS